MKQQKTQSGFAHLMIITVILAVAVVGLVGYVVWQNFMQQKTGNNVKVSANNKPVTRDADLSELIETVTGLVITYPRIYSAKESTYSQPDTNCSPYISYVVFSNEDDGSNPIVSFGFASAESIKNMDDMCMDADIITEADYSGLKQAFEQNNEYAARGYAGSKATSEYNSSIIKPKKINSSNWYAESYKDSRGMVRRYTTFVGDTQIDAYIPIGYEDGAENTADVLFAEFSIT